MGSCGHLCGGVDYPCGDTVSYILLELKGRPPRSARAAFCQLVVVAVRCGLRQGAALTLSACSYMCTSVPRTTNVPSGARGICLLLTSTKACASCIIRIREAQFAVRQFAVWLRRCRICNASTSA